MNKLLEAALQYHQAGDWQKAQTLYEEILAVNPEAPEPWHYLGLIDYAQQEYKKAVTQMKKAIALAPNNPKIYSNLGLALQATVAYPEAIQAYQHALTLDPHYAIAELNLALCFREINEVQRAQAHAERAIAIQPDSAQAHNALGVILRCQGADQDAEKHFEIAIRSQPAYADPYSNLGSLYRQQGEYKKGIANLQKALHYDPEHVDARTNLGNLYKDQGEYRVAKAYYQEALARSPTHNEARFNLSLVQLIEENFSEGFENYESRWGIRQADSQPPDLPHPHWQGEPLTEQRLLVWSEQGLGDEIMMAGLFQQLTQTVRHCTIESCPRLIPLFKKAYPTIDFIPRGESIKAYTQRTPIDYQCAMGSLPYRLAWRSERIVNQARYLSPDPKHTNTFRNRYRTLFPNKRLIGIAWQSANPLYGARRSIPLQRLLDALNQESIQWISLQHSEIRDQISAVQESHQNIYNDPNVDPSQDLTRYAAQIAALDCVISIDNTTVHLAGALGQTVWTLLPKVCDWRWFIDRRDSPWYPSMILWRQAKRDDWEPVLSAVRNALNQINRDHSA